MKSRLYILFTLIITTAYTNQAFDENTSESDASTGHNTKAGLKEDEIINLKNA